MKLYMIPECPFVQRVLLSCDIRKINSASLQTLEIDLQNPPSNLLKINPTGSVPTLEFSDGSGFHESLVIMEFLDTVDATGPKIYGSSARQVAQTKTLWETINSQILTPVQQAVYAKGNVNNLRAARNKMEFGWDLLSRKLEQHESKFFGGSELNAIDIAIAPFLLQLKLTAEVQPLVFLPPAHSRAEKYLAHLSERCAQTRAFPKQDVMRAAVFKFAVPHKLVVAVQNAPRTLIEIPQETLTNGGESLSFWHLDRDAHGYCLKAKFRFENHSEAIEKIKWLHDAQETCDHHTSFTLNDFAQIDVQLVTHEPRWGVSQKDLAMAELIQAYFTKGHLP